MIVEISFSLPLFRFSKKALKGFKNVLSLASLFYSKRKNNIPISKGSEISFGPPKESLPEKNLPWGTKGKFFGKSGFAISTSAQCLLKNIQPCLHQCITHYTVV